MCAYALFVCMMCVCVYIVYARCRLVSVECATLTVCWMCVREPFSFLFGLSPSLQIVAYDKRLLDVYWCVIHTVYSIHIRPLTQSLVWPCRRQHERLLSKHHVLNILLRSIFLMRTILYIHKNQHRIHFTPIFIDTNNIFFTVFVCVTCFYLHWIPKKKSIGNLQFISVRSVSNNTPMFEKQFEKRRCTHFITHVYIYMMTSEVRLSWLRIHDIQIHCALTTLFLSDKPFK